MYNNYDDTIVSERLMRDLTPLSPLVGETIEEYEKFVKYQEGDISFDPVLGSKYNWKDRKNALKNKREARSRVSLANELEEEVSLLNNFIKKEASEIAKILPDIRSKLKEQMDNPQDLQRIAAAYKNLLQTYVTVELDRLGYKALQKKVRG